MKGERLQQALQAVRDRHGQAKAHGVELLGVVGSVARGEDRPDSDVDIAYRIVGRASLFDLGGIQMDMQDDLRGRVDLVDLDNVKPSIRAHLERDLVRP